MNLERANTEPLRQYLDFHNRLDVDLQVLSACVFSLGDELANASAGELGNRIRKADPSWAHPVLCDFDGDFAVRFLRPVFSLGLVAAFSAFDDFLTAIDAEIHRAGKGLPEESSDPKLEEIDSETDGSESRLSRMRQRYGWDLGAVTAELKIVEFFSVLRNCIAHRDGRASSKLASLSVSSDLKDAVSLLKKDLPEAEIPVFNQGSVTFMHPKWASFCSSLIRDVANEINRWLVAELGAEGVIGMACYHAFLKDKPARTAAYRTPEKVLNHILNDRYRVLVIADGEASRIAREIGTWDECLNAFVRHYPEA